MRNCSSTGMPATVAIPADRRNGWTGPVTRSMNSGQWSTASRRPLPSLSSAKSLVPKPLSAVFPASSSRSLKDTVDEVDGERLVAGAVDQAEASQGVEFAHGFPDR